MVDPESRPCYRSMRKELAAPRMPAYDRSRCLTVRGIARLLAIDAKVLGYPNGR